MAMIIILGDQQQQQQQQQFAGSTPQANTATTTNLQLSQSQLMEIQEMFSYVSNLSIPSLITLVVLRQ
jgi:hypothetical protein